MGFGTIMAFCVNLYTMVMLKNHHVYFDTTSMLVNLLIIGRTLKKKNKRKTQQTIQNLLHLDTKNDER